MIVAVLDHTALAALGAGHPALSGFVVDAAAGRALVQVPALVLSVALDLYTDTAAHPIDPGKLP